MIALPPELANAADVKQDLQALQTLQEAATGCRECPIGFIATQTVWGEGPARAPLMLVGEQPGDQEDRQGRPFVGPAGQLLDRALAELGWSREQVYVTNAVKHFKFETRGKRRMHKTPAQREAAACLHWLERAPRAGLRPARPPRGTRKLGTARRFLMSEVRHIKPQAIVALGSTAARQLMGYAVPILAQRGHWLERQDGLRVLVTLHPSALLRMVDPDERAAAYAQWLEDLRQAGKLLR